MINKALFVVLVRVQGNFRSVIVEKLFDIVDGFFQIRVIIYLFLIEFVLAEHWTSIGHVMMSRAPIT